MEETKEEPVNGHSDKPNNEKHFPWDEWSVIDEGDLQKDHTDSSSDKSSYSEIGNTSDISESQECIEVLSEEILEPCPSMRNSELSVDKHNDESDGVSIITESDEQFDESADHANDREVVVYENVSRASSERSEGNGMIMFLKVLNVMLACSLVAIIGLGTERIRNIDDNRSIPTELDLITIKMESSRLLEQMKELSGVKKILEEIKSSILQERVPDVTILHNPTENPTKYLKKQFKILDSSINKPDTTLYERLQIFLRTICLVLEDIRQPNDDSKIFQSTCDIHSLFSDLKSLQKILYDVIDGMEPSEKSAHQRFLQNVEFQMNSMSDSFVSDLTQALDKLRIKNQNKFRKIGLKLNERLCFLRNTLSSDSELRESLKENNTFLDNCEDITTKKSVKRSKEKWRRSAELPQPPKVEKNNAKKREGSVNSDFNNKSRVSTLKRQIATSLYDTVETRKCYNHNLPNFVHDSQDSDNICATLMAPPRTDWKLKHKSSKVDSRKCQKNEREKSAEELKRKSFKIESEKYQKNGREKSAEEFKHKSFKIESDKNQKNERKISAEKLNHKSFNVESEMHQKDERTNSAEELKHKSVKVELKKCQIDQQIAAEEGPGKMLLKGDQGASKIWKKKMSKEFETSKFRKTSVSSHEDDDIQTKKRMKEKLNKKIRSGVVLSEPPIYRVKTSFEKANNEFILVKSHDENSKIAGKWQFERSRIRDQLRNKDSAGSWYFDRVSNRKNLRMNCEARDGRDRREKLFVSELEKYDGYYWHLLAYICQTESLENNSDVRDVQDDVGIKNWSTLTPKVSVEIVKKAEVEDIEIAIFLERIASLFGRIMKKLELAAALPILLEDPETSQILTAGEMMAVKTALSYQDSISKSTQPFAYSESSRISLQSFDESIKSFDSECNSDVSNSRIYEALKILNSYSAIREKVKSSRRDIAPQCHLFIEHMKYYMEHCALRIRSTPVQAKHREVHFRKIWHENHKAQKDIAALMRFLEAQRSSHYELMKVIDSQYQKDFGTVDRLNRKCIEDIKSTINRSESKQIIEYKASESRQNDLSQYLAMAKNKLEILRETNLRSEQDIRSKRFKVSSQLLGQIAKYDAEVGARNTILEQLTDEFETDKLRKEELEEKMASQLEIYNAFVEEREQTNLTIFREKLEKFVRTRAVKIIQRWWRPIFKRLKLKKKKKKKTKQGKKK